MNMATLPIKGPLPLNPLLYNLDEDEISFFKDQTGIRDDAELKNHILSVQAEAYAVFPYPCIRNFAFTGLRLPRHPDYHAVLKLGRERSGAILLDIGCCFGNDARKAIMDGFPRENVIASDLRAEYWTLGHKLFKTTQETYPLTFIHGDIFDPSFFRPSASPAPETSLPPGSLTPLSTLTSLTPLRRRISVIYASLFFHIFDQAQQHTLAHVLGNLLSPVPGSMILGTHIGVSDAEKYESGGMRLTSCGDILFGHSTRSWEKLWVGKDGVFKPEDVILRTDVREFERKGIAYAEEDPVDRPHLLTWSITRTSS